MLNSENNEQNINETSVKEVSASSRRAKFRTVSGVMTALVVAAVVVCNMLIGAISTRVNTKIDLTSGQILDLADETLEVVKKLDKEVNIYSLIPQGDISANQSVLEATAMVDEVLKRYAQVSGKIKYSRVDSLKNPEFLHKYDDPSINQFSIIFECGDAFRAVNIDDVVSMNAETNNVQFLSAEQKFTSAIMYVSSDKHVKVGVVQGHGELAYDQVDKAYLAPENYDSAEINLLDGAVAEDINMLMIMAPAEDFAPSEIDMLDAYLDRGGNVQLVMNFMDKKLPNLEGYLGEWGVEIYNGCVVEEDGKNIYNENPLFIFATVLPSQITNSIISNNYRVLFPYARGMNISAVPGVEHLDLLTSSEKSFVKVNFSSKSTERSDGDVDGPAIIATILSKTTAEGKNPKLMVMGGTGLLEVSEVTAASRDLFYNSVSHMTGNTESIYIRPKDISPNVLWLSATQVITIAGITVVLIPLLILIAGFVVWYRRRHL